MADIAAVSGERSSIRSFSLADCGFPAVLFHRVGMRQPQLFELAQAQAALIECIGVRTLVTRRKKGALKIETLM
jgi:hypothetical protein